jgi:hypothetical protein
VVCVAVSYHSRSNGETHIGLPVAIFQTFCAAATRLLAGFAVCTTPNEDIAGVRIALGIQSRTCTYYCWRTVIGNRRSQRNAHLIPDGAFEFEGVFVYYEFAAPLESSANLEANFDSPATLAHGLTVGPQLRWPRFAQDTPNVLHTNRRSRLQR